MQTLRPVHIAAKSCACAIVFGPILLRSFTTGCSSSERAFPVMHPPQPAGGNNAAGDLLSSGRH